MIQGDYYKSNALQAIVEKTEDSGIFQIAQTIEDNVEKSEVFASIALKLKICLYFKRH